MGQIENNQIFCYISRLFYLNIVTSIVLVFDNLNNFKMKLS